MATSLREGAGVSLFSMDLKKRRNRRVLWLFRLELVAMLLVPVVLLLLVGVLLQALFAGGIDLGAWAFWGESASVLGILPLAGLIFVVVTSLRYREIGLKEVLRAELYAEPAQGSEFARMKNALESLSVTVGVSPVPQLLVVEENGRNLAAVSSGRQSAVVVSRGLVEAVNLVELEALLALALVRIRSGEAGVLSWMYATLPGATRWSPTGDREPPGWVSTYLAQLAEFYPPRHQLELDAEAMAVTRYPPGLTSALSKLDGHSLLTQAGVGSEALWIAPPTPRALSGEQPRLHLRLSDRISAAEEL